MTDMLIITLMCAVVATLAHLGIAVFHDGIRPIIPEILAERMPRKDLGKMAFGLSVGFIATAGVAHSLATGMLNPWLLFLATDIIGIYSTKKWHAFILGGAFGAVCLVLLELLTKAFSLLHVDMLSGMYTIGVFVMVGFSIFPLLAIFNQFGVKKGIFATVLTFIVRFTVSSFTDINQDITQLLLGVLMLIIFAVIQDVKAKTYLENFDETFFLDGKKRVRKNLPLLMVAGALIATACNIGVFAGSDLTSYILSQKEILADPVLIKGLYTQAGITEIIRGLSFIPLIVLTATTTGVYGVAGLTFVYAAGYFAPNPYIAAVLGMLVILIEGLLLGVINRGLNKFPTIRAMSDSIRSAITMVLEYSLLIGSVVASMVMGGMTGFVLVTLVYFINEVTGKKIMKMAIGPVAVIVTGIVLNIVYYIGLLG